MRKKEALRYPELCKYYKTLPFDKIEKEFIWIRSLEGGQWRGNALVHALLVRLCDEEK